MRAKAIARIIITGVLFLNAILTAKGMNPLPISEDGIYEVVSQIASGLSILYAWWKNNNITAEAISAQNYLDEFKRGEGDA